MISAYLEQLSKRRPFVARFSIFPGEHCQQRYSGNYWRRTGQ